MKTKATPPVTVHSVHINLLPSGTVIQGVGTDADGSVCLFRKFLEGTDAMNRTVADLLSMASWGGLYIEK